MITATCRFVAADPITNREDMTMRPYLVACLALLVCLCACSSKPNMEAARTVSAQVGSALNSGDAEKLKASLDDNAVLLLVNRPPIAGSGAIASFYSSAFNQVGYDLNFTSVELKSAGDLVVDRGTIGGRITSKNGQVTTPVKGKYLNVLRAQEGGLWKLLTGSWEFDPPVLTDKQSCEATGSRSCCCTSISGDDCVKNETGCSGTYNIPILLP